MSVWYCIPSKRPPEEADRCLKLWRECGYKIALWRDVGDEVPEAMADVVVYGHYDGYARAVNELARRVLKYYPECDWIVTGGDDVEPDPNHSAEEIAQQCSEHFNRTPHYEPEHLWRQEPSATFGIMQPSGDRYGESAGSIATYGADRAAYADRVCGSPWIGREFALRINQGKGPLWPGFTHMFEDECLQAVATKLGVLWQRRDLIHYHRHWARARGDAADMPDFLKHVNSPQHWQESKAEFERLKASDFAECMPI